MACEFPEQKCAPATPCPGRRLESLLPLRDGDALPAPGPRCVVHGYSVMVGHVGGQPPPCLITKHTAGYWGA